MLSDIISHFSLGATAYKIFSMAVGLVGIGIIIAIHESGHFLFGKLFKVTIPSFSIGFGPKIFSRSLWGTQFSISLIPVGGYVEAETGNYDRPTPGTIAALPYWKKFTIIAGGILFNIVFSYLVFSFLFFQGFPQNPIIPSSKPFFIGSIESQSPAARAGLSTNDTILKVDSTVINNQLPVLLDYIQKNPGKEVTLEIQRNNKVIEIPVTLGAHKQTDKQVGILGVQFNYSPSEPLSLGSSLHQGALLTGKIFKNTFKALTKSVKNKETKQFSGPLMMIKIAGQSIAQGFSFFLFLIAYISIAIAVLNTLPLPIFDGGQALTYTIETLMGRALPERVLNYIHMTSWILMMGLFLLFTYQDIIALLK